MDGLGQKRYKGDIYASVSDLVSGKSQGKSIL